uniref:Putative secreted peptide n=1 Tax=Anopheles braziliensis TaxID=58242 RepID=A0A2M3ZSE0_9DIPT
MYTILISITTWLACIDGPVSGADAAYGYGPACSRCQFLLEELMRYLQQCVSRCFSFEELLLCDTDPTSLV